MPGGRSKQISLFPSLCVNFIGTLGFSIVLPFLVTLVDRFGGNALVYGVMGATYSAFQLVGAPLLGRWSDTYGRRKILLVSQLGTLLSWVVFLGALFLPASSVLDVDSTVFGAFALTLPLVVLFFARALDGLTGGNVSVANAYLADVTEEHDRKMNFGKMAVAGNLGFIVGPTLAGLLGATRYGEIVPVAIALVISLVASAVIAFYLPESRASILDAPPEGAACRKVFGQELKDCYEIDGGGKVGFKDVLAIPHVPFLLFLYFLIFLGFNLFYTAFPVHALRGLEWSITDIGLFFSFLGLTTVLVQGPLLSKIGPKISDGALTTIGAAILGTAFWFFTSPSLPVLYGGAALFSLGNGLMWPSFMALLANAAGERFQGAVQGIGSSVGSLASIVGLIGGGVLYETIGRRTFAGSSVLIYLVAIFCIVFAYRASRNARST
jgi:DHA1 family tetracycline resistance protein-like MFS transporter